MSVLYFATLLNLFINAFFFLQSFCRSLANFLFYFADFGDFQHTKTYHVQIEIVLVFPSYLDASSFSFSCLHALARTSSTVLKANVLDHKEKDFSFSLC